MLLGRPDVLVLDEPTNGLDPGELREVRQLVRRVADAGATVLFSSHILGEVEQICTHAVVMDKGHLIASGSVAELIGSSGTVYLEVDDVAAARRVLGQLTMVERVDDETPGLAVGINGGSRSELVSALVHAGVGVETVTARRRLEDAFLGLVERSMTAAAVMRTELYKSTRRLRTYVAYAIVCLIPVIITVAIKANPPGPPGDGGFLLFLGSQSGLLIPAVALRFTSEFLLVIVVALFAGEAIAGEATWGNLRYLLMRPIPRGRLFTSKLIVATLCGWFAVLLVVIVGLIAGGIAFGLEPIGFFSTQTTSQILGHLALSTAYVCWILMSVISFSFMIGVMTDSTFGSIFAGVGLWMTWLILDQIEPLGSIRDAFPTHYSGDWVWLFTRDYLSPDLWRGSLLTLGYVVVFLGFAFWWFRRKDVLS